MKKQNIIAILSIVLAFNLSINAFATNDKTVETEQQQKASTTSAKEILSKGKPFVTVFANFNTKSYDGNTHSQFALTRAYFGYKHTFNSNFSARLTLDAGKNSGGSDYTVFLKHAYIEYKKDKIRVRGGMTGTTLFSEQEKFWGYRYLAKSFQDEYKFSSSADLGVSFRYKFADFLSMDFSIFNGEGYKKVQKDSTFRYALGASLKPAEGLQMRLYYDYMNEPMGNEDAQQTLSSFIGYKQEKFSIAGECNYQINTKGNEDQNLYGLSGYATYITSEKLRFFGRVDYLSSNKIKEATEKWNIGKDETVVMLGAQFTPTKGVELSPNYRLTDYHGGDKKGHAFFVNLLINL